jgi:tetratricopeptide (TPR) repeat protein
MLLGAGPCAPVTPEEPDVKLAAIYFEVGEAELAAESWEAAATAFSKALAHDAALKRAAVLRDRACRALGEGSLAQVRSLMDARQWAAALAMLQRLPSAPEGARALLEGVCQFELGEDAAAKTALERALKDPLHEDDARLLLSLLALRRGSSRAAEQQLRSLEQGGRLGAPLTALLRQVTRTGTLVARGSVFGGVDSNPTLAPEGMEEAHGFLGVTALTQWAPLGQISPYVRLAAGGREYLGFSELRTVTGVGTLGFQLGRGGNRLALDYSLDGMIFGADPYAITHGPRLEGSYQLGPVLLVAEWMLRLEDFLPEEAAVFSGLRQDASVGASAALPEGFSVELGWGLTRDEAKERELSLLEHGPRVAAGWSRDRTRAMLGAELSWRTYDLFDSDLGVRRADVRVRPSMRVEFDFTDWLSAFVTGDASLVNSNVEAVSSVRFTASAGVQLWGAAW